MKLFNVLTHPIVLSLSFSFIIISGEKFDWFYLLGIMMGLMALYLHSILGIIGILMLLTLPSAKTLYTAKYSLNLLGSLLLILSLISFFLNDHEYQNWNTFYSPASRMTLILFMILWLLFVAKQIIGLVQSFRKKGKQKVPLY